MINSLFDRCLIANLYLLESKCLVPCITAFSPKNLFDCCLINTKKQLKRELVNV